MNKSKCVKKIIESAWDQDYSQSAHKERQEAWVVTAGPALLSKAWIISGESNRSILKTVLFQFQHTVAMKFNLIKLFFCAITQQCFN